MKDPEIIDASRRGTPAVTIQQTAYPVAAQSKMTSCVWTWLAANLIEMFPKP
jgi:hypothetical protein